MHSTTELVKKNWKMLALIVGILVVLGYITYSFTATTGRFSDLQNDLKSIKPSEETAYRDLNGNIVDIRDFRGTPLIVNSWASWSPFSQTELPLLAKMTERYGDRIVILAMNRMESVGVIQGYLSAFGLQDSTVRMLVDPSDTFYKAVGGYAMPETVFYDTEGVMIEHFRGLLTEDVLSSRIESMIK